MIRFGVTPGTPVALIMSNCLECVVADQAIIKSGGVKVPLNDMLAEKEIGHILTNANARLAVVGPNFFDIVQRNRTRWPALQVVVGLAPRDECPDGIWP